MVLIMGARLGQIVLDSFTGVGHTKNNIWKNDSDLLYPAYFAILSIFVLTFRGILLLKPVQILLTRLSPSRDGIEYESGGCVEPGESSHSKPFTHIRPRVDYNGGPCIFSFKVLRLVGCLALVGLTMASLAMDVHNEKGGLRAGLKYNKSIKKTDVTSSTSSIDAEWIQVSLCLTYVYASFLALLAVSAESRWAKTANTHLVSLLLFIWAVFAYRDFWPLATYTLRPADLSDELLWVKLFVLTVTAVVIPLVIPRQYIPLDPKNPAEEPNPEQTASILSFLSFSFLDPLVSEAYRVPHLPAEQFPPLADYDRARVLKARGFRHVDSFAGARKEHLFFAFMRIFSREYIVISIILVIRVLAMYASPVGINELLRYLETGGASAFIRPWMWVSWLFLGPILRSIVSEWYMFISCHLSVQAQGIIIQLIFEHALRIRMKAEMPSDSPGSDAPSAAQTRRTASITGTDASKIRSAVKANLSGRLNNLVTSDMKAIVAGRDFMSILVQAPLAIGLGIWFLYSILGWSAIVGMAVLLIFLPAPGYLAKLGQEAQITKMKKTDSRVQTITETMNAIRMIKLFAWERNIKEKITEKRKEELKWIQTKQRLDIANETVNFLIPLLSMAATFATYTLIMEEQLSASAVFSSMAVFDMLNGQLREIFHRVRLCIRGKVSLDRVSEFLEGTELLDGLRVSDHRETIPSHERINRPENANVIGFSNASFVWSNDDDSPEESGRKFRLILDENLIFKRGGLNLIIGPSGSGKTSLLMALLGEMHFLPSGPMSWYSLPRDKGVAYVAQESWVQNETIRANIIFGAQYDEERYKKVIYQCGLERDLGLFDAGDQTEVGERGITLSGGQKARVTLARAVYSSAEILLLDDVLAALDVHTSRWIVEKCFQGDLLRGRTVLLVTHNVDMVKPCAAYVVSLGADGRISGQGPSSETTTESGEAQAEVGEPAEPINTVDDRDNRAAVDAPGADGAQNADGKLIAAEEIAVGHVSWLSVKLYIFNLGGLLFWFCFFAAMLFVHTSDVIRTWYLGYWATQYETHEPSEVSVPHHLAVFCAILSSGAVLYFFGFMLYIQGGIRASKIVHERLISAILGATLRWLDTTPTGRTIARCTQDIISVDGTVAQRLGWAVELTLTLLINFVAIIYMSPIIILPGVLVGVIGAWCGLIYVKAQLSVKRELSNAKSPVLNHFSATMAGLVSIRAFGAQDAFKAESLARLDNFARSARIFYNLNRWVSFRIQVLGATFSAALAAYLVYGEEHRPGTASDTGLSLNLAVRFSSMILTWVRVLNNFEVAGNSLERIQGYIDVEQEPEANDKGVPPAHWPSSGNIHVEKLSARYSPDGPEVLHDLSFTIKSGERIGVVGRTGSGKSSLTLSLLRCILTKGNVIYDGLSTSDINLDALRRNITIIPQVPELLSGSLRYNLDPFDEHDDATLNAALRSSGLFSLQSSNGDGRITLDSQIASGGSNLSVGQRQILALARAIVRRSKLLILDEATSAIDYATDSIIQGSLRTELSEDVTCITVAHRLQTIMDADKIMVLDAGRLVEFDSPRNLLNKEGSFLKSLVDESGDRDALYAMASAKAQPVL